MRTSLSFSSKLQVPRDITSENIRVLFLRLKLQVHFDIRSETVRTFWSQFETSGSVQLYVILYLRLNFTYPSAT